jgi:dolichyl-phosphate-mannose--protein O-mannosyl transferase
VAGAAALYAGVLSIATNPQLRATPRGGVYLNIASVVPLYFLAVPLCVYALSYTVWVAQGGSVVEAIEQNKSAYHFHSTLTAEHGYQSSFWEWPIMGRPIYLAVGDGDAKIYSMGNPWLFWLGIPALAFTLFQGIKHSRLRLNEESGILNIHPRVIPGQLAPLFVVLGFLALWLPWALNPRTLFLYHYLPAVAFMVMAMGYCVHWLWHNKVNAEFVVGAAAAIAAFTLNRLGHTGTVPDFVEYGVIGVGAFGVAAIMIGVLKLAQGVEPTPSPIKSLHWGQIAAIGFLALIAGTFIYFYPHMTYMDVPGGLDRSYFWFDSWR